MNLVMFVLKGCDGLGTWKGWIIKQPPVKIKNFVVDGSRKADKERDEKKLWKKTCWLEI